MKLRYLAATAVTFGLSAGPAMSVDQTVGVGAGAFSPETVTIEAGESVTWRWNGPDTDYSVTSRPGSPEAFESDPGKTPAHNVGDTFKYTFVNPGTYPYADRVHGILGAVIVRGTGTTDPVGDVVRPKVSGFRATPSHFCRRKSRNQACKGRVRTRLRFKLSENASVGVDAVRTDPGHRKITSFRLRGTKKGVNTVKFSAKRLVPGRYRISLIATDRADNESRVVRTRLTIIDATSKGSK